MDKHHLKIIDYFVSIKLVNRKSVARHTCAFSQVARNAVTGLEIASVLYISSLNGILIYCIMAITTCPHPYLKVIRTRNRITIWSGLIVYHQEYLHYHFSLSGTIFPCRLYPAAIKLQQNGKFCRHRVE